MKPQAAEAQGCCYQTCKTTSGAEQRRALNTLERLTMKSLSETQSKDLGSKEHGP